MKENAISALQRHREKSGDCCRLNCETDSNIITRIDSFWEYLWSNALNMCCIEIADSQKKSINAFRGAHNRVIESYWELGNEFTKNDTKCLARKKVLECLEYNSKKSILKAYSILSYMIRKISKAASSRSIEFDEMKVLSHKQQRRVVAMNAIIESASTCIKSMKKRMDKRQISLLTGVAAIFLPPKSAKLHLVSCNVLSLNPKSSYVKLGVENRNQFNEYLNSSGPLQVGERVVCRGGIGKLVQLSENSCVVEIEPWNNELKYDALHKARLTRYVPILDEYEREERSDMTPQEWIDAIELMCNGTLRKSLVC
eukprot:scaffold115518_cov23-Cyclotella_meneghiniana.AAC.1